MIEYIYIYEGTIQPGNFLADEIKDIPYFLVPTIETIEEQRPIEVEKVDDEDNIYYVTEFEAVKVERTEYYQALDFKVRILDYEAGTIAVIDKQQLTEYKEAV